MDAGSHAELLWTPATMPLERVPARLEMGLERYEAIDDYMALRLEGAAWLREQPGEDRGLLGRELLAIEPLLARSVLLDQPSVAGMGLFPWDRVMADAPAPGDADKRTRRMVRGTMLEQLMDEEPVVPGPRVDPAALARGADLVEALQRLRQAEAALPPGAPASLRERLAGLRAQLAGRLRRERAHDAILDAALGRAPLAAGMAEQLRARSEAAGAAQSDGDGADVRVTPRASTAENPYEAALEQALAIRGAPVAAGDATALAAVRNAARDTTQAALAADPASRRGRRLVEQARGLFAREAALTGGRPGAPLPSTGDDAVEAARGVDTLALRRLLAGRAGTSARPADDAGVTASAPEVPIYSGRGARAKTVGYLAAGETLAPRGEVAGFTKVSVPGRLRAGWIPTGLLRPARAALRKLESPAALEAQRAKPVKPREKRVPGAMAMTLAADRLPMHIDQTDVELPSHEGANEAGSLVRSALAQLPDVLGGRLAGAEARARLQAAPARVEVDLAVPIGRTGDPKSLGRFLADRVADELLKRGSARVESLKVRVHIEGTAEAPDSRTKLLSLLNGGDTDGVARLLAEERRTLDAVTQSRLVDFFGHDFGDVTVFAGPMSGALARSLQAEAFTHGKLVFFDPKHFRLDTAAGEALVAHELAHTRQADEPGRGARMLEAEALAAEAAYLDWVSPGGAPLARDKGDNAALEAEAAKAGDVAASGGFRARSGRQLARSAGPRVDAAQLEARVDQVLRRVTEMLRTETDFEEDRIGRVIKHFTGPF